MEIQVKGLEVMKWFKRIINMSMLVTALMAVPAFAQTSNCTLYASATGSASNSGTTATSPITLAQAFKVAIAGDNVCIAQGNYTIASTIYPSHGGNESAWVNYTSYNGTPSITYTGSSSASDTNMIHLYSSTFPEGPSYISFNGLAFTGSNNAFAGISCSGSSHIKVTNSTFTDFGGAGIYSTNCDYTTAEHNTVFHSGYNQGWTSGIDLHAQANCDRITSGSYAYCGLSGPYSGMHNIVADNTVAAEYDGSSNHSDGNGIIVDNGGESAPNTTDPDTLIVNNVVYGNGGRCIEFYLTRDVWVLNNTCYSNGLDLTLGDVGEIVNSYSNNDFVVNNIVYSWDSRYSYQTYGTTSNLTWLNNLYFNGSNSGTPSTGFLDKNPDFASPPAYNATAGGQYANTINPATLGADLTLQSNSSAIGAGVDPISLATNANISADLAKYIYTDINGNARIVGSNFTLGAYTGASQSPTLAFGPIATQTYGTSLTLAATSISSGAITYSVVSGPATISGNVAKFTGEGTVTIQASVGAYGDYGSSSVTTSFSVKDPSGCAK